MNACLSARPGGARCKRGGSPGLHRPERKRRERRLGTPLCRACGAAPPSHSAVVERRERVMREGWKPGGRRQGPLSDALKNARLRTYHGCRVKDAGLFHRTGLHLNDPAALADQARRHVSEDDRLEWMRPKIDQMIEEFDSRERDTGRLYLCADDRGQLTDSASGHYCLYGSEWIQVLLGWGAHEVLRSRGVPTILEIDLPLAETSEWERQEFAQTLLQEWIHAAVNNPDWVRELDFTFMMRNNIPPSWVVGHFHPARLHDPFHKVWRKTADPSCPHCRAISLASPTT